jgi:hypothetical protein
VSESMCVCERGREYVRERMWRERDRCLSPIGFDCHCAGQDRESLKLIVVMRTNVEEEDRGE